MIQFNLLPDIKVEYLKANRHKHFVVLVSVVAIVASAVVLIILLSLVFGLQKKNLSDLSADIKKTGSLLQSTPQLTKILTVQNQLKSLPSLHDTKPVVSRLFSYLGKATPGDAKNARVLADFEQNSLTISGTANALSTVNQYIDALKGSVYYDVANPKDKKRAFSNVVLAAFGRDNEAATYTITIGFDPAIFSQAYEVAFEIGSVPKNRAGQ